MTTGFEKTREAQNKRKQILQLSARTSSVETDARRVLGAGVAMFVAFGNITLYDLRVQFVRLLGLSDCHFLPAKGECPLSERVLTEF